VHVQHVLASVKDRKAETRTPIVDSIHEIRPEAGQIVAVSAERTTTDSKRQNHVLDAIVERLNQM
jgi:hypothetical protein